MIILVSTVGPWIVGPVTQIHTLTNIVGVASLWLYVLLLLSFFLYKVVTCIKTKRRETVLWYLLIVTILFLPLRSTLLEHRIEAFKEFAINLQHKCKQVSDCSRDSEFPWTIGKVVETKWSRNQAFSFHIELGGLTRGFTGGVNHELFYIVGVSDDQPVGQYWCSQRYKYVDGKWIEVAC